MVIHHAVVQRDPNVYSGKEIRLWKDIRRTMLILMKG